MDLMAQRGETLIITVTNGIRSVVIKSTLPEKKKSEETLNMMVTNNIPHVGMQNTLPEEKKNKETLNMMVTNNIPHVDIENTLPEEKKKVEHLPMFVTVINEVHSILPIRNVTNEVHTVPPIRDVTETGKEETLKLTETIMNELNAKNMNTMVRQIIEIKIETKAILEDVLEIIHQKALGRPNMSGVYAELCAILNDNSQFNKTLEVLDITLLMVLLPKCLDFFYSYKQPNEKLSEFKKTITPQNLSHQDNACLLANSIFISELYNRGVLPESIMWLFVMDLARSDRNAEVHCLTTILQSAGPQLSKTYSLTNMVGHLLVLENDTTREEIMCSDLRILIHNVKIQHAKFWIHEEPDRAVKDNMRRVNPNLIKPNKSISLRKEYALNLMVHCALVDCWDLLSTFTYRKNLNEVKHLMSPALNTILKTNQMDFILLIIATALKETCPQIRANAGKLLADFVKTKWLSQLNVYSGFKMVSENNVIFRDVPVLVSKLESEFTHQLSEETLKLTETIMNELNAKNMNTMVRQIIEIKIETKAILEDVLEIIHQKALSRPNMSGVYAELCAILNDNSQFNKTLKALDVTLLKVLLPKCFDVFYSYKQSNQKLSEFKKTITPQNLLSQENACLLANSIFISELYNRGVLPESIMWSFVMDLARPDRNAQVHCLATILQSAGPRLSKTYSLASMVGHLLILENDTSREEIICSDLRILIHNVKIQHAKFWIHEEPDRAVKENMRRVNPNLVQPSKLISLRKEYALNLMAHCALVDCWDLLSTFTYRKNLNEVKQFMSPALNALLKTNQMNFILHIIVTAVKETCPHIKTNAGKLLADFVKAKWLSQLDVYSGFEMVNKNNVIYRDVPVLVSKLESEFTHQLSKI